MRRLLKIHRAGGGGGGRVEAVGRENRKLFGGSEDEVSEDSVYFNSELCGGKPEKEGRAGQGRVGVM